MDLDATAYSDSYSQDVSIALGMERGFDSNENRLTNQVKIQALKMRESDDNFSMRLVANLSSAARFTEQGAIETSEATDWQREIPAPDTPIIPQAEIESLGF
jgi:hypothetical protein